MAGTSKSLTDVALEASVSNEADELRRRSKKWIRAGQSMLVLAALPMLIGMAMPVFLSVFGFGGGSQNGAVFSFIGGIFGSSIAIVVCGPIGALCAFKGIRLLREVDALISGRVKQAVESEKLANR